MSFPGFAIYYKGLTDYRYSGPEFLIQLHSIRYLKYTTEQRYDCCQFRPVVRIYIYISIYVRIHKDIQVM